MHRIRYLFIVLLISSCSPDPCKYFGSDYHGAIHFYKKKSEHFAEIAEKHHIDKGIVFSVGFPELVRYTYVKDLLETLTLELLYTSNGSDRINFSVGRFQMKPSFAESIEKDVCSNQELYNKWGFITSYLSGHDKKIRKERMRRLKDDDWQFMYLCAFYDIVKHKFPEIKDLSRLNKIRFFSAAYNHSYHKEYNDIFKWHKKKLFPFGVKKSNPFSYSEVAVYFYKNDFSAIFSKNK